MLKNYKNFKQILIIFLLIMILIIGIIIYFYKIKEENDYSYLETIETTNEENLEIETKDEKEMIVVHITGQVINQGIVKLEKDSRIIDAIEAAGGTTKDADLTKINLAYIIEDGVKIYIPSVNDKDEEFIPSDEENNVTNSNSNKKDSKDTKIMVNINTASVAELQRIPGVGQTIADRIINYRKEKGKFKEISEIKEVSGIGDSKYERIKEYICVK